MTLPFTLPDWLPGWAFLLLALPVLLWALAFLLMPFSVFGLKSRLEALEGQIDALHEDVRMMAMRATGALPPAARNLDTYDDVPNFGMLKRGQAPRVEEEQFRRAPIPTPQPTPARERLTPTPPPTPPRPRRSEPRFD